jgi:hypothetical protein
LINRLQGHSKRLGQGALAPDYLDDFLQHTPSKAQGLVKRKHSLDTLAPDTADNEAVLYDTGRFAVARRLKSAMDALEIKNVRIAEVCDVSEQAVGGWLKTGRIDEEHFPAICKAINRSPVWLATGLEPESFAVAEAFQEMPQDLKPAFQKVADTFRKSAQLIPWDEKTERRRGGLEGR